MIPRSSIATGVLAAVFVFVSPCLLVAAETSSTTIRAKPIPPDESPGERPYEMVLANRRPPRMPLVDFDSLEGWTLECANGGEGELLCSRKQRVWESPVARLVYRGKSAKSTVTLRPLKPIRIPDHVSAATVWIYGNNWSWVPDRTTPQVRVSLLLHDAEGKTHAVDITRVRWKEWWLVHKVLPEDILAKAPVDFAGIRVGGCANEDNRELYFEDLAFFRESPEPLSFAPRPKRGIDPFPGQSPGANRGPGRLPFPTSEETILPENLASTFTTKLAHSEAEDLYRFVYEGSDAVLEYEVRPGDTDWGPVRVKLGGVAVAEALVGAGPVFPKELRNLRLMRVTAKDDVLSVLWRGLLDEDVVFVESDMRLMQKSLVVDYICRGGFATELSYGHIAGVEQPELIILPYLNYGGHHLNVLMSRGAKPFFASVWMDWYRSNASAPYAVDKITSDQVRLNGGVRYSPKTDGERNSLFERVFVTFSPTFEETLPTIANPPAKRGKEAGTRLWQESWGPKDYERERERSRRLRAYGIEMLTQCNHEITWRDGGESFTFRTMAAPGKGGDEALQRYVQAQRSLGWRSGLYTNYCDFAPVNAYWDVDMVMRRPSGDLVTAWPRCYSPKALFAVEMDRKLAPLIQEKFDTNAAYTDVHTAVSPWDRADYDARVPGAGTFAATFYAYGELLLHDQDVYDGHCWSEGNHQWLYAGLCTGNYGLAYSDLRLWKYPYLPHFDLLKMHPLSVDIGVPWTSQFFSGKEGWNKPENIESSIDQFIAATIAYGHIGWLVEETHGIRQTCRSYYMLQQLQRRYVMLTPEEIQYGTKTGMLSSSAALLNSEWKKSRLFIRYPNSLQIWINGNAEEEWEFDHGGVTHVLPPYGWLAIQSDEFYESSELLNGKHCDRVSSAEYVFIDGRGSLFTFDGIATSGSLAVRRAKGGSGLSAITVEGVGGIGITSPKRTFGPEDVRTEIGRVAEANRISVRAFDQDGKNLGAAPVSKIHSGWKIQPREGALRYKIRIE
ncbi:hypothetical protein AMJ85_02945 [candidate division BRC1 bacterium SM23_51]|nr:MAG: hypothetical protein AMJ85_02945 [candidate division BRC1 bacterium SM23_51]